MCPSNRPATIIPCQRSLGLRSGCLCGSKIPNALVFTQSAKSITYLPRKAVAEVSNHKEPIGRRRVEFNWFESQLMSDPNELRVKWFGCQVICDSSDLVVIWFEIQMILVVKWFETQMIWLSSDLRFKWFGCHLTWDSNDFGCQVIWNSSDLDVEWFEIQMIWLSSDLRFKWFGCQLIWDSNDLVINWFEIQVIWLSIDLWVLRLGEELRQIAGALGWESCGPRGPWKVFMVGEEWGGSSSRDFCCFPRWQAAGFFQQMHAAPTAWRPGVYRRWQWVSRKQISRWSSLWKMMPEIFDAQQFPALTCPYNFVNVIAMPSKRRYAIGVPAQQPDGSNGFSCQRGQGWAEQKHGQRRR